MTERAARPKPGALARAFTGAAISFSLCSVLGTSALAAGDRPAGGTATPRASDASDLGVLRSLREGGQALPFTIESGELELRALPDESRVLLFLHGVLVRYGETELRSDELEAFYPPEESQPSRMLARGNVRIDQREQRATCEEAEYRRDAELLICRGQARLSNGCDVVEGDSIELDLAAERARVVGAARVVIAPRGQNPDCPKSVPSGSVAP